VNLIEVKARDESTEPPADQDGQDGGQDGDADAQQGQHGFRRRNQPPPLRSACMSTRGGGVRLRAPGGKITSAARCGSC